METTHSHLYEYLLDHTRSNKTDEMKDVLLDYSAHKEKQSLNKEYMDVFVDTIVKYLNDDAIEEVLVVFSEIRRYMN